MRLARVSSVVHSIADLVRRNGVVPRWCLVAATPSRRQLPELRNRFNGEHA